MKRGILRARILLDPAATLSQRAASMLRDERHACGPKPDCCAECGMDGPAGVDLYKKSNPPLMTYQNLFYF